MRYKLSLITPSFLGGFFGLTMVLLHSSSQPVIGVSFDRPDPILSNPNSQPQEPNYDKIWWNLSYFVLGGCTVLGLEKLQQKTASLWLLDAPKTHVWSQQFTNTSTENSSDTLQKEDLEPFENHNNEAVIPHWQTLKEQIANVTQERDSAYQKLTHLEEQLKAVPHIPDLILALESAREELDRIKQQTQEMEQFDRYVIDENNKLEEERKELAENLRQAQVKINHFQSTFEQLKNSPDPFLNEDVGEIESFFISFSPSARTTLAELFHSDEKRYKKVYRILKLMQENLRHHSLQTHKYESLSGPHGEEMFESYVEQHTPNAWRIFWYYGPGHKFLTIHEIKPHP